jgi:antitoxin MazE
MKTRIVRIGNSEGVRIPKPLLERSGLKGDVELEVQDHQIVIRSASRPRSGWEQQFEAIGARGDDGPLDADLAGSSWDEEEWTW